MSTAKRIWIAAFYWMGMAMTLACFAFVAAGNTELFWRFEHTGFPLSWAFAGVAMLAFLAAELCSPLFPTAARLNPTAALEYKNAHPPVAGLVDHHRRIATRDPRLPRVRTAKLLEGTRRLNPTRVSQRTPRRTSGYAVRARRRPASP